MNPSFDAAGEYLYFLSYRNFEGAHRHLRGQPRHPRPGRRDGRAAQGGAAAAVHEGAEGRGEAEGEREGRAVDREGRRKGDAKGGEKSRRAPALQIDLDGIGARVFKLPVEPGNYFYPQGRQGPGDVRREGRLRRERGRDDLHALGRRGAEAARLLDGGREGRGARGEGVRLAPLANREQAIVRKGAAYHVVPLAKLYSSKSVGDKLSLEKMSYRVKPREEWTQVFNDAWRWYRDFFYDPDMHGHDWKQIGDKFRAFLPSASSRAEVNWLLSQMVGELCVSHTYVGGGDMGPRKTPESPVYTGLLGADLRPDASGYYRLRPRPRADRDRARPRRAARPPRRRRQGGRLPDRRRRHDRQGARQPVPPPAGHQGTEGEAHRQRDGERRRRPHGRGRAGALRDAASLQPLAAGQRRHRAEGLERRDRLHAHHRDGHRQRRASSTSSGAPSATRRG